MILFDRLIDWLIDGHDQSWNSMILTVSTANTDPHHIILLTAAIRDVVSTNMKHDEWIFSKTFSSYQEKFEQVAEEKVRYFFQSC